MADYSWSGQSQPWIIILGGAVLLNECGYVSWPYLCRSQFIWAAMVIELYFYTLNDHLAASTTTAHLEIKPGCSDVSAGTVVAFDRCTELNH